MRTISINEGLAKLSQAASSSTSSSRECQNCLKTRQNCAKMAKRKHHQCLLLLCVGAINANLALGAHLRGAACLVGPEGARLLSLRRISPLWPAALFLAVFLPAAVALLAVLHHAVATESIFGLCSDRKRGCDLDFAVTFRTHHLVDGTMSPHLQSVHQAQLSEARVYRRRDSQQSHVQRSPSQLIFFLAFFLPKGLKKYAQHVQVHLGELLEIR